MPAEGVASKSRHKIGARLTIPKQYMDEGRLRQIRPKLETVTLDSNIFIHAENSELLKTIVTVCHSNSTADESVPCDRIIVGVVHFQDN